MSLWFLIFLSILARRYGTLSPKQGLGHTLSCRRSLGMHIDKHAPQLIPFLCALHLGTALALLVYFRQRWVALVRGFFGALSRASDDERSATSSGR